MHHDICRIKEVFIQNQSSPTRPLPFPLLLYHPSSSSEIQEMDGYVENHRAMPPKVPTPRHGFTLEEYKKSKLHPKSRNRQLQLSRAQCGQQIFDSRNVQNTSEYEKREPQRYK